MDLRALFTEMCDSSGGENSRGGGGKKRSGQTEKLSGSRLAAGLRHAGLPLDRAVVELLIAAFSNTGGRGGLRLSYADFHRMVHCDGLLAGAGSASAEMGAGGGYAGRPGTLEEQVRSERSMVLFLFFEYQQQHFRYTVLVHRRL